MTANIDREQLLEQIRREFAAAPGKWLGRRQFLRNCGLRDCDLFRFYPRWSDAVSAAGIDLRPYNMKLPQEDLLEDWGDLVRQLARIPTRKEYKLHGSFSPGVFESNFGPWSAIPSAFLAFAEDKPDWVDVVSLLPATPRTGRPMLHVESQVAQPNEPRSRSARLAGRQVYGDPIDFRGLRHAPVNETGVVLIFGMIARELGYLVEGIQTGFPDCDAKRQIGPGKWQRVRIEFEYESANFVDHGHDATQCDVIVCWRHNWLGVPDHVEVIELSSILDQLGSTQD